MITFTKQDYQWLAIKQFEEAAKKQNFSHWLRTGSHSTEAILRIKFIEDYKFNLFLKFDPTNLETILENGQVAAAPAQAKQMYSMETMGVE